MAQVIERPRTLDEARKFNYPKNTKETHLRNEALRFKREAREKAESERIQDEIEKCYVEHIPAQDVVRDELVLLSVGTSLYKTCDKNHRWRMVPGVVACCPKCKAQEKRKKAA